MAVKKLQIVLAEELYYELIEAAVDACCEDVDEPRSPEDFAKECVESVLAERRADRRRAVMLKLA